MIYLRTQLIFGSSQPIRLHTRQLYYGFQWDCESEQCPKDHIIIVIIFLLWLTSV